MLHAAAPCPVAVKRQMIEWWGPIIHEYYAGTEDIGHTSITPEEWLAHPGSVGRSAAECHIVGEDGEELPTGQSGVIYFAAGRPFEYHNDPAKTASVSNEKGWRTLGDVGYLDEEGYLYLTDRQAHMIISGGVNIYPQEAENLLTGHPAVVDVAVIGVPDEEMGEAVKAVVQLTDQADAGPELEAELLAFCRAELGHLQVPAQRRLRRRAPPRRQRQALQAPAARALLGGPRLPRDLTPPGRASRGPCRSGGGLLPAPGGHLCPSGAHLARAGLPRLGHVPLEEVGLVEGRRVGQLAVVQEEPADAVLVVVHDVGGQLPGERQQLLHAARHG